MSLPRLDIPRLLREHGLHARKSLGQNFLVDETALEEIVRQAEIPVGALVLEIGPGLGSLTRHLALKARRVVAVELDAALIPPLQEVLHSYANINIIQGDILELDPAGLMGESGYQVVANIPYYITSAIIRHLLESSAKPARLVLTVQKEVAQRICAAPGDLSLLALSVQVFGAPRIAGRIPAGAFYPPPKVDSAVIRVDLYDQPLIPTASLNRFFALAKAGFGQKRKTLRNSLSAGMGWRAEEAVQLLVRAGIDPQRRAETLSIEEWGKLLEKEEVKPLRSEER